MNDSLPHEWEPVEVARLARIAAHKRWAIHPDYEERCDIAALAMIEYLYTAEVAPSRRDLLIAAHKTLDVAIKEDLGAHGLRNGGESTGRCFGIYWHGARRLISPMEERLLDHIALYQVFPMLSPIHKEAIIAVADNWGDRTTAAHELGITRMALMVRLSRARAEFRWYWFWPETPPKHWGNDMHWNLNGHQYADGRNRAMVAIRSRRRRKAVA